MANQTADEIEGENIAAMGPDLGRLYSALWQALATIYFHWNQYVVLFGTKPQRIELLNQAAPAFFRMLQDELWDNALLHLARLTDPANSSGRKERANLTIRAMPELIVDIELRKRVEELIAEALRQTDFARDWRNRYIAHRDLQIALKQPTTSLPPSSRLQVKAALGAIAAVLNETARHYLQSETHFDHDAWHGGAISLLHIIDDGLRTEELRQQRLREGRPLEGDRRVRDL